MNVRVPITDSRDRLKAYGLALQLQNGIIDTMTRTIESLRVKGKSYLYPFQKGSIKVNGNKLLNHYTIKL